VGLCQFVHHRFDDLSHLSKLDSNNKEIPPEMGTNYLLIASVVLAAIALLVIGAKIIRDKYKSMKSRLLKTAIKGDMAYSYSPRSRDGITINSERKDLVISSRSTNNRYTKFEKDDIILEELEKDIPLEAPRNLQRSFEIEKI